MPGYDRPRPPQFEPPRTGGGDYGGIDGGNFSDPISNMTNISYTVPHGGGELFQHGNAAMQAMCGGGGETERSSAPDGGGGGGFFSAITRGISGFASGLLGDRKPAFNREARPCTPAPAPTQPDTIMV